MTDVHFKSMLSGEAHSGFLRWWSQVSAVLLVVVELCWVLPWFTMASRITSTAPPWVTVLVLGGIMLAAYALGGVLETLRLLKNLQAGLMAALLVLSLLLAENFILLKPAGEITAGLVRLDPGAVLVLFFVIWMWWRGASLARGEIRPMVAWRRFEQGVLFFMAYIFVAGRIGYRVPGFGAFILFLFAGLLSVAFARIAYVGLSKGVRKNPFDLRWFASLSGVIGIVVLAAALLGGLLSGQYRLLLDFLGEAIKFLIAVTIFILGIPGLLASYLFAPLLPWLRSLFSSPEATLVPDEPAALPGPFFNAQEELARLPLNAQMICFWGLVLLVVLLLVLRVRQSLGRKREVLLDEPESLLKEGEAGAILRKALQEVFSSLGRRLRPVQRALAAARIRGIYLQLLELCAELSQPRLPQQTPLEFMPEMGKLFASRMEDLRTITLAYNRVRYGELPEILAEMDAIEAAWGNIQKEGERLKKSGVGKLKTAEVNEVERERV